jgi:hypothetical protein
METLFSLLIGVSVTLFFVRRHVKTLPPEKADGGPARRKHGSGTKGD